MNSHYRLSDLKDSAAFVLVRSAPSDPGVELLRPDATVSSLPDAAAETVVMSACRQAMASPSDGRIAQN